MSAVRVIVVLAIWQAITFCGAYGGATADVTGDKDFRFISYQGTHLFIYEYIIFLILYLILNIYI